VTDSNGTGVVMHENGYAHGLDHPDEPNSYIMTLDREHWEHLDYTDNDWETFKHEVATYLYNT
jgi:hypothetical protein